MRGGYKTKGKNTINNNMDDMRISRTEPSSVDHLISHCFKVMPERCQSKLKPKGVVT